MSAVQFVSELYNGQNTIRANAGDWIDGVVTFQTRFQVGSGASDSCTYIETATTASLVFQQTSFELAGFMVGDVVEISYDNLNGPPGQNPVTFNRTINYVSGTQIQLNSGFPSSIANGDVFPTSGNFSGINIVAYKKPNATEFFFNLTTNGQNSLPSVVDGSLTRFQLEDSDTIAIATPTAMTQMGNGSGGYIKDVMLTYVGDALGGWYDWKVTYTIFQWGVIKDGYNGPTSTYPFYNGVNHLAPLNRVKVFAELGNPNGVIINNTQNTQANTGGFNENYNGGNSLYTVLSTSWVDALSAPIDSLDYSGECTFTSVISAPTQTTAISNYRLGLVWRPIDGTYYQQRIPSLANNLLVVAPETDFVLDAASYAGPYLGFPFIGDIGTLNTDGAQWDIKDVRVTISGADEITVVGTVVPNAAAAGLFVNVAAGGRKSTLWLSLGDHTKDGQNNSTRVSLTLWDEDNYDAPTLGVQMPDVVDENLYDHDSNDIDTPLPQTTTEDDVLYVMNFKLLDDLAYEGIRTRIYAYNTVSEEEFTLEDGNGFISFANVPFVGGIYQVDYDQSRNFNLPPTSDRNHISLVRNTGLDGGGKYGLTLEYGFLNDWRYWLEQANADDDFFDYTIPDEFNGKNKNWQHYSDSGNWIIRIAIYTRLDGVDDFNYYEMGIREYEDDVNVSSTEVYTVVPTGTVVTALINNQLMEVESTVVFNGFVYTNEWVEFTIEDYQAGNRWVLSSVLAQGNVANNPLKPIAGQTLLDVTGAGTSTIVCKGVVDCNLIDVNKVTMSVRVYSEDVAVYDFLITALKDAEVAYSLRRVSNDTVYTGNCIRVRRDLDNAEQDIGFLNNVLDEGDLLDFVTNSGGDPTGNGYIVKWYDQSGEGNDAQRAVAADQPRIVVIGVVEVDPNNGLPAAYCDGINDYLVFTGYVAMTQLYYQSFVFNRVSTSIYSVAIGGTVGTNNSFRWDVSSQWVTALPTTIVLDTGRTATGDLLHTILRDSSDNIKTWENGTSGGGSNSGLGAGGSLSHILKRSGALVHSGHVQELIYYTKDKESNRSFIETNTNDFYSIF